MIQNGTAATAVPGAQWRKSSFSNSIGNCVEFAGLASGQVAIRNSRFPNGPALVIGRDDLADFVEATKAGRHDDLLTVA